MFCFRAHHGQTQDDNISMATSRVFTLELFFILFISLPSRKIKFIHIHMLNRVLICKLFRNFKPLILSRAI